MLAEFTSPFDATAVRLLREAGADIIGKANCDEFGMGSLNKHSHHGPTINPFRPSSGQIEKRYPGGSSGGSAAAVAAGMCQVAIGTDTGGSVRLPASYCGISGLKPSYGLISRWGVVSYADSLDCVGVLAKEISDIRVTFGVLSTYDNRDPTSASPDMRSQSAEAIKSLLSKLEGNKDTKRPLDSLRIGVPQEFFPSELSPTIINPIRSVIRSLRAQGATIVPVSLPSTSYALSSYYVLASAEASSNLARYDGLHVRPPPGSDITKTSRNYALSRTKGFGPEVKRRILLGTYALTADAFDNYFLQAQRVRQLIRNDFNRIFSLPNFYFTDPSTITVSQEQEKSREDQIDVLIHPSAIRTAPRIDDTADKNDGDESDLDSYVQDVLTVPASLAGIPALSVPVPERYLDPKGDGWPIGVSVVGQWGSDELVMRVGEAIERLNDSPSGNNVV
ncbi:hypothetical protein NP233_g5818 [Leucocoprinus birnbaumii]|uniref:Glutamyl-tRNA(Gln) amidotransferase subunit A, mitochondrial n=1 Tax=Leucocoprinus birnbaumii TaxID=56174 RepID=A0AAD5YU90_9AGAR|nr:hypothetical protein NP233_g5818 [Leucocoprinus birnbaumii]